MEIDRIGISERYLVDTRISRDERITMLRDLWGITEKTTAFCEVAKV